MGLSQKKTLSSIHFASLSEAMEARAHQRAERRKEIEEVKRKKEEEKLVSWGVIFWRNCVSAAAVVQVVDQILHGLISAPCCVDCFWMLTPFVCANG